MTKPPTVSPDKARVPVHYETACKELAACASIDEAKYFADKAEALAAWAKIYKSDQASVEAKRLKAHAYRRMGQIADELQPTGRHKPGPAKLLLSHGLTEGVVERIRTVSKISQEEFDAAMARPNPPSIRALHFEKKQSSGNQSSAWITFASSVALGGLNATSFRSFCRRNPAKDLAEGIRPDEVKKTREIVTEIQEWLDRFEMYLPKA